MREPRPICMISGVEGHQATRAFSDIAAYITDDLAFVPNCTVSAEGNSAGRSSEIKLPEQPYQAQIRKLTQTTTTNSAAPTMAIVPTRANHLCFIIGCDCNVSILPLLF